MPEKFIKEIEEILKQADEVARQHPSPRKPQWVGLRLKNPLRHLKIRLSFISPAKLMLAGISLFLIALILNATIPSTVRAGPLVWAGVALFVTAYILYFIHPSGGRPEKWWRDKPVEDDNSKSLVNRVRSWWYRKTK